jgi:hypothetical protein
VARPMPGAQLREWAATRRESRIPTAAVPDAQPPAVAAVLAESAAPLGQNTTTPAA